MARRRRTRVPTGTRSIWENGDSEALYRIHAGLAGRLKMKSMIATLNLSLIILLILRLRSIQENARSTVHLFGMTSKPKASCKTCS